jgi:FkbM family methyltransferase
MRALIERAPLYGREPPEIKILRHLLRRWPFHRGKGFLLELCRPTWQRGGFPVEIEPGVLARARFDDYVFRWAFTNGFHMKPEIRLSRALIERGHTVVDAGANIGLWCLGAALRTGPGGSVHAFEPVPENFDELMSNVGLNRLPQVRPVRCGLSDRKEVTTLYAATNGNSGMASLGRRPGVEREVSVELTTLDEYCEAEKITRVDFLKLDVEGAELPVLQGGRGMLKQAPMILFEVTEQTARVFGRSTVDVKAYLSEMGFQVFRMSRGRLQSVGVEEVHEHNEDLLALKPCHFDGHDLLGRLVRA